MDSRDKCIREVGVLSLLIVGPATELMARVIQYALSRRGGAKGQLS